MYWSQTGRLTPKYSMQLRTVSGLACGPTQTAQGFRTDAWPAKNVIVMSPNKTGTNQTTRLPTKIARSTLLRPTPYPPVGPRTGRLFLPPEGALLRIREPSWRDKPCAGKELPDPEMWATKGARAARLNPK